MKKVNEDIKCLNLEKDILDILKENEINIVEDLWKKKRVELKGIGLTDSQINQIIIKLELLGLGLNKKKYK